VDRWFSSPKIFDHLWGCKIKAVGRVMSNIKKHQTNFFWRTEKRQKISCQWDHLLAIQWKDIPDVFFLTTAHEDVPVQAPLSRGAHHET
jgi:hypothetical protein